MPSLDAWLTSGTAFPIMTAAQRAVREWIRIQDRPTSVVLNRAGVAQTAQTMRIEYNNTASNFTDGTLVRTTKQQLTLFGVRSHPTVTDTNIQKGDRFTINGLQYEVKSLLTPPGEVQAISEGV